MLQSFLSLQFWWSAFFDCMKYLFCDIFHQQFIRYSYRIWHSDRLTHRNHDDPTERWWIESEMKWQMTTRLEFWVIPFSWNPLCLCWFLISYQYWRNSKLLINGREKWHQMLINKEESFEVWWIHAKQVTLLLFSSSRCWFLQTCLQWYAHTLHSHEQHWFTSGSRSFIDLLLT